MEGSMNRFVLGAAAAALALGAGCGGSSNNNGGGGGGALTSTVACNIPAAYTCYTYTVPTSQVSSANSACASGGGAVVTSCPAGGVGTCSYSGTGTQAGWTVTFEFYPPMTATSGHTACNAVGGSWSGGFCPSTAPLDCNNTKCCPAGYPYDCPVQGHCWSTPSAAAAECGTSYATCM